jgi:hypothetical protein
MKRKRNKQVSTNISKELLDLVYKNEKIDYNSIDSKFACNKIIQSNKDQSVLFSTQTEISRKEKIKHRMLIKLAEKEIAKIFKPIERKW